LLAIDDLEEEMEVGMVTGQACRYQSMEKKATKIDFDQVNGNKSGKYNALPYDYDQTYLIMVPAPVFHAEIGGLTRSGRCFTLEELENQRKAKGKDVAYLTRTYKVNRPVSNEEAIDFLKLMKHREYSIID